MSLFRDVSGCGSEDIATEVVAHLLSQEHAHVPFQKLFYQRVLKMTKSSDQLEASILTQPSLECGLPDFAILTSEALIVGETKLGAFLSGDSQLVRYCEPLENPGELLRLFPAERPSELKTKTLVLLAPAVTIELSLEATNRLCRERFGQDFAAWRDKSGIQFVGLPWEELVTDLDSRDSLQDELRILVGDFIRQELTKEERMILEDKTVPAALEKLFELIGDMRDHLTAMSFRAGRLSQSYNYYGFPVKLEGLRPWFGYFLSLWKTHGTPVFLTVRDEWINNSQRNQVVEKLTRNGFVRDATEHFVRPFSTDRIGKWKEDLTGLLENLATTAENPKERQEV